MVNRDSSIFLHQSLQNEIIYITRPIDKKKIMFYNDRAATLGLDEEFQKLWRSVAVESMDDQKIEEYLEKQVCSHGWQLKFANQGSTPRVKQSEMRSDDVQRAMRMFSQEALWVNLLQLAKLFVIWFDNLPVISFPHQVDDLVVVG